MRLHHETLDHTSTQLNIMTSLQRACDLSEREKLTHLRRNVFTCMHLVLSVVRT